MIIHNSDGNPRHSPKYGWRSASVNAAGTAAATSLIAVSGFETLLSQFGARKPRYIKVQSTGAAYLKLNSGDVITIGATTPFEADYLRIDTIGISTNGSAQTITVQLQ